MRKWILGIIILFGLTAYVAEPLYAQNKWEKLVRSLLQKNEIAPLESFLKWKMFSRIANEAAFSSVSPLFVSGHPTIMRPLRPAPEKIKSAVFTLQHNPRTHGKGSAFAIEVDGEIWGVTARHIFDDIGRAPFLSVQDESGKSIFFQVYSAREGNVHGADIAVFRLPKQVLAYIKPLKIETQLPEANQSIQSAGFSQGIFGWFADIKVLFSSQHRILARYKDFPVRSGYCGSPLIKDGKVIGVFVGVSQAESVQATDWYQLISPYFKRSIHSFAHIVPISWVYELLQQEQTGKSGGVVFSIFDTPLGILHPDENIHSIQQIRHGRLYNTLYAYPFMDYAHLERFLEIEPQDIIRITVQKGDRSSAKRQTFIYEFNVETNKVSRMEK